MKWQGVAFVSASCFCLCNECKFHICSSSAKCITEQQVILHIIDCVYVFVNIGELHKVNNLIKTSDNQELWMVNSVYISKKCLLCQRSVTNYTITKKRLN